MNYTNTQKLENRLKNLNCIDELENNTNKLDVNIKPKNKPIDSNSSTKVKLSISLDRELSLKLESYCRKQYTTRSSVIECALIEFFNLTYNDYLKEEEIEDDEEYSDDKNITF